MFQTNKKKLSLTLVAKTESFAILFLKEKERPSHWQMSDTNQQKKISYGREKK